MIGPATAHQGGGDTESASSAAQHTTEVNTGTHLSLPAVSRKRDTYPPCDINSASNDPSFTQESAMAPMALVDDFDTAGKQPEREGEAEFSTTSFSDEREKSRGVGGSSKEESGNDEEDKSSSSSFQDDNGEKMEEEDSDDEEGDDREEGVEEKSSTTKEKEATTLEFAQHVTPANGTEDDGNEKPQQLYPLTQLPGQSREDGEESSTSGSGAEKVKPVGSKAAEEDNEGGSSFSSSSSSSDGSSSDSSSCSSDNTHGAPTTTQALDTNNAKLQNISLSTQFSNESAREKQDRRQLGSQAKVMPANNSKAAKEDKEDGSSVSSSTSSASSSTNGSNDGSSTSSSSSSSDSKEDERTTQGASKDEAVKKKEEERTTKTTNKKSLLVSSRGSRRRRTPLVSTGRKIVINASNIK